MRKLNLKLQTLHHAHLDIVALQENHIGPVFSTIREYGEYLQIRNVLEGAAEVGNSRVWVTELDAPDVHTLISLLSKDAKVAVYHAWTESIPTRTHIIYPANGAGDKQSTDVFRLMLFYSDPDGPDAVVKVAQLMLERTTVNMNVSVMVAQQFDLDGTVYTLGWDRSFSRHSVDEIAHWIEKNFNHTPQQEVWHALRSAVDIQLEHTPAAKEPRCPLCNVAIVPVSEGISAASEFGLFHQVTIIPQDQLLVPVKDAPKKLHACVTLGIASGSNASLFLTEDQIA